MRERTSKITWFSFDSSFNLMDEAGENSRASDPTASKSDREALMTRISALDTAQGYFKCPTWPVYRVRPIQFILNSCIQSRYLVFPFIWGRKTRRLVKLSNRLFWNFVDIKSSNTDPGVQNTLNYLGHSLVPIFIPETFFLCCQH